MQTEPYSTLNHQLKALLDGEEEFLINAQNFVALVYHGLAGVNWLGFYWLRNNELVVGPFQGQPACTRIALGQGVCGTAATHRKALIIEDVRDFEGHIACDPASRSEIVIPIILNGSLLGVLDVDSPEQDRFGPDDQRGLEALLETLLASSTIELGEGGGN